MRVSVALRRYGTIKGSYVDMYFSGQVELSNMYRLMEEYNMRRTEDALAAVRSGDLNVFFWDSPRLGKSFILLRFPFIVAHNG